MRWQRGYRSSDVIDRRGERSGPNMRGGGMLLSFLPLLLRSRLGRIVLVVGAVGFFAYRALLGTAPPSANLTGARVETTSGSDTKAELVGFTLDDAQATWRREFAARGQQYRNAKLVLFTDRTPSGCGYGQAATGPFYCPVDERVYIDLGFYDQLEKRFGAPGAFAESYVIAHEIGHHVQNQLGISSRIARASRAEREGAGGLSVRQELQADCFAGVWARDTARRDLLEGGDIESALNAAAAIGDDRLQRQATGTVSPESWTHGSSQQRVTWFRRGYETGPDVMRTCDTFGAESLD